ncbi:LexA family protein [Streptomyces sp. NPDC048650]|uniref:LexA family protein n=1 Tax=Streptomyces sp. NPDC048650 TaxID=3365583 RepID=UPI003713EC36
MVYSEYGLCPLPPGPSKGSDRLVPDVRRTGRRPGRVTDSCAPSATGPVPPRHGASLLGDACRDAGRPGGPQRNRPRSGRGGLVTRSAWKPAAERRSDLLRRQRAWIAEYGEEPSVRELAEAVGISPSTASLHLTRMREDGIDIGTRGVRSRRCPHCGR